MAVDEQSPFAEMTVSFCGSSVSRQRLIWCAEFQLEQSCRLSLNADLFTSDVLAGFQSISNRRRSSTSPGVTICIQHLHYDIPCDIHHKRFIKVLLKALMHGYYIDCVKLLRLVRGRQNEFSQCPRFGNLRDLFQLLERYHQVVR